MFGQGISREGDLLDLAADCNVVNKSGAWYAYQGEKIGQGRENAKQYLKEHSDISNEIEEKVRAHYNLTDAEDALTEEKEKSGGKKAEPKAAAGAKTDDKA